jgi:Major Facilitator Superfamily
MAEAQNEKMAITSSHSAGSETPPTSEGAPEIHTATMGKPWMYRRLKLGPISIPAYATPEFQIIFVALVCFLCPGMFNAVNGLGAGGLVDPYDINRANIGVYATFSVVGFFSGSIANAIGLRLTLGLGGFGYCIYVAAILSYNHTGNAGFLIFSGCLLGACAGLLWCAQGAVMMAYPTEGQKGRFISWFWMIFNLGGVIGSLVPLGQNINSKGGSVNDGTYIAFIILMASGFVLAGFLCNPLFVQRKDGSHVIMMKNPTWKSEFIGMFETFRTDWYIVFLFPFFLSSNWFYTYHFQDINAARFNIRTRALNSVLYWTSQIIGAAIFGFALDSKRFRRSTRAKICIAVLFLITMVIWGGGYDFQKTYTRADVVANKDNEDWHLDWTDSGYIGPMFLYMFYGMFDAAWQTSAYWSVPIPATHCVTY